MQCSIYFSYIENKVSQFEFLHLEEFKYKREMERTIQLIPSITGELRQVINIEETNQEFSELMRFNNFGKLIISSNDIQALVSMKLHIQLKTLMNLWKFSIFM